MSHKNIYITFSSLLKAFLVGILVFEVIIISEIIGKHFARVAEINQSLIWIWGLGVTYVFLLGFFLLRRKFWNRLRNILYSWRIDLLALLITGIYFAYLFNGFGIKRIFEWIELLSWGEMRIVLFVPFVLVTAQTFRLIQLRFKNKTAESLFISDKEGTTKEDDGLDFLDQAKQFGESVFNQGASESLVFGIDAPWGTGKSTFINFCKEYWSNNHKDEMIVYSFDPLRYENQDKLLEKFVDGLIKEVKEHMFAPEIESLLLTYEKYLNNSKASFPFFGLNFDIPLGGDSIDGIFERLEAVLSSTDKKIVIVVDDLDRLNFSSIKEVLFVIKKSFTLPNISYVLCYDTENISALEKKHFDTEKIIEFLEKFVNLKISLFLDHNSLKKFFLNNLYNSFPVDAGLVKKIEDGVNKIFESKEFHNYSAFFADARKIKRFINTISLLKMQRDKTSIKEADFDDMDIDANDLIHLLLIYINYPNIFRKIYNTETQGRNGFFSVVYEYVNSQGTYKNSSNYEDYLRTLDSENQKFALNQIFDAKDKLKLSDQGIASNQITRDMETSYACFNGSLWSAGGRNLEEYLYLITKMRRPSKTGQYKFYVKQKDRILLEEAIPEVLKEDIFSDKNNETTHEQLWRVLVNTPNQEYSPEKSKEVIKYAIQTLPKHSLLEIESIGVGFRNTLIFFIVKLLDQVGWADESGKHSPRNTEENVIKIADWIFGENDHAEDGVLKILANEERGVIGLYDLLLFRLRCSYDRGGDIFNLSRALSKHGDLSAPTEGSIRDIVIEEMREISQMVFQIFKKQYVDVKKNIFDEIDKLTLADVCGDYFDYVNSKMESGEIEDIEKFLSSLKSRLKAFIIYQLGNMIISHGIGCGYYDIEGGEDRKTINSELNKYLFDLCFSPLENENNYMHFLDYLLINFTHTYGATHESEYVPHINEFTKVFDKEMLLIYWYVNGQAIKDKNFHKQDRKVITANYTANYNEDLSVVYEVLDRQVYLHRIIDLLKQRELQLR